MRLRLFGLKKRMPMFRNYFKVTLRNLFKNKSLSFINISGLAMGMAFAILIGLWIQYETSYDGFHQNKDRIAMVMKNTLFNEERNTMNSSPLPLYYEFKNNFPEVKRASRLSFTGNDNLVVGNNKFNRPGNYVDADFLSMFSFSLLEGNAATALTDPNSIVLTESLAAALFGKEDPIGKTIRLNNEYTIRVTGLLKDLPKNSTLSFDFLVPYQFVIDHNDWIKGNQASWTNNFLVNVVELKEGVSMEAFSKKIGPLNMQRDHSLKNQTLFLHPLSKWHLYDNFKNWENVGGKIDYVRMFGIIGIFVLLIACINFMNLSTARSELRMKEVGIRKTLGSRRVDLILQFLSESLLTAGLSFLFSLGLIKLLLPSLKDLGFENIDLDLSKVTVLGAALILSFITGLVAGSYPALYLSSFMPVSVLKGLNKQGKESVMFRRVLVISQFSISVGLIICTVIVFQQISHGRDRSIGYNPNNLLTVEASKDLCMNFDALKQDLLNTGVIGSVAKASQPMNARYNSWGDFSWAGKDPHADIAIDAIMTEWDFEKTVGLKMLQGRPFSKDYKTDSNGVILNEAALKIIGYKDPIGKTMKSADRVLTIVGITEDVLLTDPFKSISPLAILFNGSKTSNVNDILIRLKPTNDLPKTLAAIQPVFARYNPSQPWAYHFADDDFGKKFSTEKQVGKLAGIFAGLGISISCLGLFGLAMFMAERRNKEIGVRKVLGASVADVVLLLSKEFVWLVGVGCLIAGSSAYWLMHNWLEKYEYRIGFNWWVFAGVSLGAILIALVTTSFQAIRAARVNPVKSLKAE